MIIKASEVKPGDTIGGDYACPVVAVDAKIGWNFTHIHFLDRDACLCQLNLSSDALVEICREEEL